MTRVLITGADGFIGSGVLKYLLKNTAWQFVCLCSWRHHGLPQNIEPNNRVTVFTCDLTGPIPDLGHFDYILNLASESHVDRSIADPVNFIENNVSSTLQVLEYARKQPPMAFIQFSTDEVYGDNEHQEWDLLLPSSPYGASKAAQEVICIAYWRTYKLPIVITNSNNIVGERQNPEKFVPKIIDLIKSGREVEIHTNNGVPAKRHWNPVDNVAAALLFILNGAPTIYEPGLVKLDRYGIPGGKELDNLQMAQLVADKLSMQLNFRLVDGHSVRPGYDKDYPRTDGKLTELGFKPPLTLEEGMEWVNQ